MLHKFSIDFQTRNYRLFCNNFRFINSFTKTLWLLYEEDKIISNYRLNQRCPTHSPHVANGFASKHLKTYRCFGQSNKKINFLFKLPQLHVKTDGSRCQICKQTWYFDPYFECYFSFALKCGEWINTVGHRWTKRSMLSITFNNSDRLQIWVTCRCR